MKRNFGSGVNTLRLAFCILESFFVFPAFAPIPPAEHCCNRLVGRMGCFACAFAHGSNDHRTTQGRLDQVFHVQWRRDGQELQRLR